jgi:hypothetical protein
MDLTVIYIIFHLPGAQYIFFSADHVTFSKIDHISGHKESLNRYKKIEITQCILSDHSVIKTRHQQQKKLQKTFKHIKTEQDIIEQSVSHQRNKVGIF